MNLQVEDFKESFPEIYAEIFRVGFHGQRGSEPPADPLKNARAEIEAFWGWNGGPHEMTAAVVRKAFPHIYRGILQEGREAARLSITTGG